MQNRYLFFQADISHEHLGGGGGLVQNSPCLIGWDTSGFNKIRG